MANHYFQFRHFTVQQQHCAMKVCTDACIFGAFAARIIADQKWVTNILDVGAGTGLLSLMLAQQQQGNIDAVELDEAAYRQAKTNFEQSPWSNRLQIFNMDVKVFYPGKKYEFIISNPPFFEGDLKSVDGKKNEAKHDSTLTLQQLLTVIDRNLSPDGSFAVLLPQHRVAYFNKMAGEAGYSLNEQLLVQHTALHPVFRSVLFFSLRTSTFISNQLIIKNASGSYSEEFTSLLKAYYLQL